MILTVEKKKMTHEEFMQLPDVCVEFIDGYVVKEPTPLYGHQEVSVNLVVQIFTRLQSNNKGKIVTTPLDVFLDDDIVQPDLLFMSAERIGQLLGEDGKVHGAPDVVFEIISPSTAIKDTNKKFKIYEQHGVKEYFIVYPDDKMVIKYVLENGMYHEQYREIGFVQSEPMGCEFHF